MLSTRVIGNLLTDNAFLGIAAVGMTFVILSGGIDLSIGSVIAFTGVFLAVLLREHRPASAVRLRASRSSIATAVRRGDGARSSTHLRNAAFIVTLAGMFLARGMAFVLSIDCDADRAPVL